MTRLVFFLVAVLAVSAGLAWLADNPGTITVDWLGYRAEPSVFQAVVALLVAIVLLAVLWSLLLQVWDSPAALGRYLAKRRQRKGLDALSSGMIAVGAGDRASAVRFAVQARRSLPNEPLTHLLRAQAAQLTGDKATARRIFEAMLASPDTEPLGLRGLYLEAERESEPEAQRQFAERANRINPKLAWPADALFGLYCREGRWAEALETLSSARRYGHVEKPVAERRRAVLLTAQAQSLEESNPDKALALATEAHGLAPDLIPAAAIAGRLLASRGHTAKAARVLQKTWAKAPHPDLATAYAYARIGDSPRDRLDRVKQLAALNPHSPESPIAVATAAIEARQYSDARHALLPLLDGPLTRRLALLMARIEGEEKGDKGRVREWLARAAHAARDPVWTADGFVSDHWAPVSPVTGALDAFRWRVPVEEAALPGDEEAFTGRLDDLPSLAKTYRLGEPDHAGEEEGAVIAGPAGDEDVETLIEAVVVDVKSQSTKPGADESATREASPRPVAGATPHTSREIEAGPSAEAEPRRLDETARLAGGASEGLVEQPDRLRTEPGSDRAKPEKTRTAALPEPKIFVAPPAPDDPGAGDDDESLPAHLRPYRSLP